MKKIILLLIGLLSFAAQKSYATHALGGDLMYEQISATQYLITLRIYRDCNGSTLNNTGTIDWTGTCGSGSAIATRVSSVDITPLCPGLPTACAGGSGNVGIEEHIYTATVTVPAGCNDINFNYTLCCRNLMITTLLNPNSENIFLYTKHLNTSVTNHSPFFNNYPSPIVCVNQPVVYNHGVYDPEGDSLYFFQGDCYGSLDYPVTYLPMYSGVTPLITVNPIVLNPNTGAISFTPNMQQVGVMCIVVEEWRNGVQIGETIRDIQFNVIACSNVPPQASGINNQSGLDSLDFMISVCENSMVCFDLSFTDADQDGLTVSWNQEINDATFQVFNNNTIAPTGQFCWTPNGSDLGLNFFSINIQDDACPIIGSSTYTYTVQVTPNQNTLNLTYDNSACVAGANLITLTSTLNPIDSVYWSPSPTLNQTSLTTAEVFLNGVASYPVVAYFSDGCSVIDTANFTMATPINVTANANTTNICNGGTIVLNGSGASTYTWNNGVINGVPFVPPVGVTTYVVTGVDANSCTNTDSIQVTVNPILNIGSLPGTNLCAGDALTLSTSGAATYSWNNGITNGIAFVPPVGTTSYVVTGTDVNGCVSQDSVDITVTPLPAVEGVADQLIYCAGAPVLLVGQNALSYSWDNGVVNNVPFVQASGTVIYTVTGTNSLGCMNTDTVSVSVAQLPNVQANTSANNVCEGIPITLTGSGAQSYVWDNGVVDGVSFVPRVGTATYVVTGTDANGCVSQDNIVLIVNPLPLVKAMSNGNNLCVGSSLSLTGSGAQTYVWNNGVSNGISFVPAVGTINYTLTGTDANGCVNTDNISIVVNPLPSLTISASSNGNVLCAGDSLILSGSGAQSYSWNNGVVNGVAFAPPVGTTTYIVTGSNANACYNVDTIQITVNSLPNVAINASGNNLCAGESISLNGTGAQSYLWNNGGIDGVAFVPLTGTTIFTLNATDSNGCVNQDSIAILVNALPQVGAVSNGNNICDGNIVVLNGTGAQSYTWNNNVLDGVAFVPSLGTTTYTVTGTDNNGCQNQANIDILVNSLLSPGSVIANTNGNDLCEGTAITLSGSGAQSYIWNNGVQDGVSFVPPVGTTMYVVKGLNANACFNYDSIEIVVNPLPVVTVNLSANNVCHGDSVTLSCSNLAFHTWNFNNIVDGVPFLPALGTTQYILTAMDFNGCVNEDSVDLIVHPLPNVLANSTANQICEGNTLALFGTNAVSYVWNNGVQNGVEFTPPVGVTSYHVVGTNVNGCINEDDITIQAFTTPTLNPVSSDNMICEGEYVTLIGAGAQSYTWNNGVINGVPFVPLVGVNSYIVTGIDGNSCASSDTLVLTVNPLPTVLANTSATSVCVGEAITLFCSGALSYTWENGLTNGASVTPTIGLNSYTVTGIDVFGCVNTDTISVIGNSLGELNAMQDIMVCDLDFINIETNSTNMAAYRWGIIENGVANELTTSAIYSGVNTPQLQVNDLSAAVNYTFYVELTDACGNILLDTMELVANQAPVLDVLKDTSLCIRENNVIFADLTEDNLTWSDGTVGPYLTPEFTGFYSVTYEEKGTNCIVSDNLYIEMEDCADVCVLVAPTGFSPNNDGVNDGFRAIHPCNEEMSYFNMMIYDRWGSLVFQTNDPLHSWDGLTKGAIAPIATYGFVIDYTKEYKSERESIKGNVLLLR